MDNPSRRNFNKLLGAGVVAIPASALLSTLPVRADDAPPMVDPESDPAKGLQYIEASEMEGKNCASCVLYQPGEAEGKGICPLFQGSSVGAEAWCSAYAPKA